MKVYQINYDLRNQRDYTALINKIKAYDNWAHPLESCWVITTEQSAKQVRDNLLSAMDGDDGLLVTRLQGESAWRNLSDSITSWLKGKLSQAA